jgi:DNA-binding NarL/FixJ family response regulator
MIIKRALEEKMKYNVLWVEDGAFVEIPNFAGPVTITRKYDLRVAKDVSDAVRQMQLTEFDAVIVDIRLPPGSDPEWENHYKSLIKSKIPDRLGIQLLFSLLKPDASAVKLNNIPSWISPGKFGVFTVEGEKEVMPDLSKLGVLFYRQKKVGISRKTLLDLIEAIIEGSKQNPTQGVQE